MSGSGSSGVPGLSTALKAISSATLRRERRYRRPEGVADQKVIDHVFHEVRLVLEERGAVRHLTPDAQRRKDHVAKAMRRRNCCGIETPEGVRQPVTSQRRRLRAAFGQKLEYRVIGGERLARVQVPA